MTGFKLVSGIFRRRVSHSKRKGRASQVEILNGGRQQAVEEIQPQEDATPGWFYWKLDRLTGPFSDVEILDLLEKGELQPDSMVTLVMPLAMLLQDPAKRKDTSKTMVHLRKPGPENAVVTNQDAKNHVISTRLKQSTNEVANAQIQKRSTWAFPKAGDAKKFGEVWSSEESEQAGDKFSGAGLDSDINRSTSKDSDINRSTSKDQDILRSTSTEPRTPSKDSGTNRSTSTEPRTPSKDSGINRSTSKKTLTFKEDGKWQNTGHADAPISDISDSEIGPPLEMGDKAKTVSLSPSNQENKKDGIKAQKSKTKAFPSKAATIPSKTAAKSVDHGEARILKPKSERKTASNNARDVLRKP
jgi:hypothetical protein